MNKGLLSILAISGVAGIVGVGEVHHPAIAQTMMPSLTRSLLPSLMAQSQSFNNPQPSAEAEPMGGLFVTDLDNESRAFPLRHTDVQAQVSGNVARVEVTQTFENPYNDPLEAIYVFPLPDEAAVDDMEITIGDRTIRGDIKRREEAQAIYEQAIEEGRTAGLLEQERANIFTQSLANIRPGEQIDVTIRYTESLSFEGGNYEFVFPMVVGPRYIPGQPMDQAGNTTQVPDADAITPPVLRPEERSGHDIAVTVAIDAGVPIQSVTSPSHDIVRSTVGNRVEVSLDPQDTIPNKDLILRYEVMGDRPQSTVLTQRNDQGGHFAAYLIPAVDYHTDEIVPKDVIFLMDTSGSQSGDPLIKSQELMRRMINGLNPDDTFNIIDFANSTRQLSPTPLPNSAANRRRAIAYVNQLQADGGTALLNGIQTVLNFPPAPEGRVRSIVLLTDGYIGNEAAVIAEVQQNLAEGNRLYSFGVGSSTNRFLLDRLAEVGRGTSQVVRQDEPTEEVAERFFRQINNPVLTNIRVTWEGEGDAPDLYPLAPPDLFAEQPLVLFGRVANGQSGRLRIRGTAAGGVPYDEMLMVNFDQATENPAIAQLWGRSRIKDLMNQMYAIETVDGVEAITETALNYRLLSQYTAFVAVSEEVRVDPDGTRRTVDVPLELPEGTEYEGFFGSEMVDLQFGAMPQSSGSRGSMPNSVMSAPAGLQQFETNYPLEEDMSAVDEDVFVARVVDWETDGIAADLEAALREALTNHIEQQYVWSDATGIIALEVRLVNGVAQTVLFDDQNSTIQDIEWVRSVRDWLQRWQYTEPVSGTVRLSIELTAAQ